MRKLCVLIFAVLTLACVSGCSGGRHDASIGIIGGADGPAAIFVTGCTP